MYEKIPPYKSIFDYQRLKFLITAASLSDLPVDSGSEVAVIGRSNSGKSTLLNCIANQRRLARTSKTPGRTQHINLFELDAQHRLVDLPGYGYAKASRHKIACWQKLIIDYLDRRQCLCALILLMDCRHPLQSSDKQIMAWASKSKLPLQIILTKSDKVSRQALTQTRRELEKQLSPTDAKNLMTFSSKTRSNLDKLYQTLDHLLSQEPSNE